MALNLTDNWQMAKILTDNWHLHPHPDPLLADSFTKEQIIRWKLKRLIMCLLWWKTTQKVTPRSQFSIRRRGAGVAQ